MRNRWRVPGVVCVISRLRIWIGVWRHAESATKNCVYRFSFSASVFFNSASSRLPLVLLSRYPSFTPSPHTHTSRPFPYTHMVDHVGGWEPCLTTTVKHGRDRLAVWTRSSWRRVCWWKPICGLASVVIDVYLTQGYPMFELKKSSKRFETKTFWVFKRPTQLWACFKPMTDLVEQ